MRTKNTYLWGNRAVSVVHYRLSLHEDKEHLPVGKQGSFCGTLQAVTARGQRTATCEETGQSLWYTTGCHCPRTINTYLP